mgnify:CR=1 FL=1
MWEDYAAVFVANGFYRNWTEFKTRHLVYSYYGSYPKLERYLDEPRLEANRAKIVVPMPFERYTERDILDVEVGYNTDTFKSILKDRMDPESGEPYQGISGVIAGLRRVVGSDPSRLDAVRELMKKHPKLIIFYNYDYELEQLRTLAGERVVAELNGHKHQDVPEAGKWLYLVQYASGAEAWNCIETDAMIFYSLPYSYKQYEQAQGRIDRLNTPFKKLYYYRLISSAPIDKSAQKALENKEDFNAKTWAQSYIM